MNSFLSYLGGKSRLVSTIVPLIPKHKTYAEPFCGAAWVLFGKEPSPNEIINDINVDLVNLFRIVQNHLDEFVRYFRWVLISRDEYARLKKVEASTLTDIQRAARFFYMMRLGYAGKPSAGGQHFTVSKEKRPSMNLLRMEETLSEAHLRLAQVWIEQMPYDRFIEKYDREGTFFYCDPPYHGSEKDYGNTFSFEDFTRLRDILLGLKGRFLLSINDTPEIREIFSPFMIGEAMTRWETRKTNRDVKELLIRNYRTEPASHSG